MDEYHELDCTWSEGHTHLQLMIKLTQDLPERETIIENVESG